MQIEISNYTKKIKRIKKEYLSILKGEYKYVKRNS